MQRENTISEHLRDLLDIYPKVKISGIGVFSINSKPAWIDTGNSELYPPTKTLSILEETDEGVEFIKVVTDLIGEAAKESQKIRETLNHYVSELQSKGRIHVEGIGVLSKGTEGLISLVDVHPSWGEGTAYLPVLPLSPVMQSSVRQENLLVEESIADVPRPTTLPDSMSNKDVWKQSILPLTVLGIGVCFLLWYFSRGNSESKRDSDIEMATDTLSKSGVNGKSINLINVKYQGILTEEILAEGCKIVVGSYKQKANAQTQSSRISELGYHVQLSTSEAGYRVLIVFDCKNTDLKSYLNEIKTKIAPNAWYLYPEIRTEDL